MPDGRPSTLFDEFCVSLSCIPSRMNGGMLLMSGDVLLLFNALQIDLERVGAACFSIKAPVSTGTRHGVFLSDGDGGVSRFLHKQSETTLRQQGAVNTQDMVDIDTGAVWLDKTRVQALYSLIAESEGRFDRFVNDHVRLSLYGDFVYPMAASSTLESYLGESAENVASPQLAECRREIWKALEGTRLALIRLSPAEFIHFGTTKEWQALLLAGEEKFGFLNWRRVVLSAGVGEGCASIGSVFEKDAIIGKGSAVEDSRIGPGTVVGENCVISGAELEGVTVPRDTVLHVLPVDHGKAYCARLYGVNDNPKEAIRFGKAIGEPLWTAPLHPVMPTAVEAARAAVENLPAPERISLMESFRRASMESILSWQSRLSDDARASRVVDALVHGIPVEDVLRLIPQDAFFGRILGLLQEKARQAEFPWKHRIYFTLARAIGNRDPMLAEEMDNACWHAINDHLLSHAMREMERLPPPAFAANRVEVALPVRVNWGGGWSDTPPYCLENGGTVLNAAVLLAGKKPVEAVAERIAAPVIRIISDDLGVTKNYASCLDLLTGNPHDPHALCKAALLVCGVIPYGADSDVAPILERIGGGISLRTAVRDVPKGSGLGTSSILCAAVAKALSRLLGQPDDDARISSLALCMEQLMNTGGGWQDQVGGLFPGIKLISSRPGTPQRLTERQIAMPDDAFDELSRRLVLVFTGQRRLARNILRDIMGKAVANHSGTLEILGKIQRLAVLMAFELETGDIDQFAKLTREHWALSKRLDAGSSNTCIDHMVTVCEDLIDGMMICGAGGGGFMSMILKRGVSKQALSDRLDCVFQESGVKVWDAELER